MLFPGSDPIAYTYQCSEKTIADDDNSIEKEDTK
jgi:hypothetical protein